MTELGDAMRRLREECGMSQPALARELFISQSTISRVENGKQAADEELIRRLDDMLSAGGQLVALWTPARPERVRDVVVSLCSGEWLREDADQLAALLASTAPVDAGNALRLAHEWLVADPPQVLQVRSGRRIGADLVATLERRVIQLRHMDDYVGGGDLAAAVDLELDATVGLLREAAYTEQLGRRLLVATGELAQLSGWVHSDAGHHRAAERIYLAGVRAAHAAGDEALAGNLLSSLSYQVANVGDPHDAVLMARSAYRGARSATATVRALLGERVAWAHAKAGQGPEAERTLGEVDDAFAAATPADDPEWVYWLSRDEVDVMAGRCYTELRRPMRAEPLLRSVLARYDVTHARERALYLTWLAETYLWAGEVEQAAVTATEALALSGTVNSERGRERVRRVREEFAPHRRTPAVREFEDRFRAAG